MGRFSDAAIYLPGGCAIGRRPIDLHIKGLSALGANVHIENGLLMAKAEELVGKDVYLDQVSVGGDHQHHAGGGQSPGNDNDCKRGQGTACGGRGQLLNCMGAKVKGAGTDIIKVRGVEKLHGCSYSVIPDQIEAGTLMIAAAATRGDVTVQNVIPTHMDALTAKLLEMGVEVEKEGMIPAGALHKAAPAGEHQNAAYPGSPRICSSRPPCF